MRRHVSSPWGDPIRLVRYLARLMTDPRVPTAAKLKVAGAGIYSWIDGDIIADPVRMVPGLGYIDDFILTVHGIKCLVAETDSHTAAELWPGDAESFKRTLSTLKWVDDRLYGTVHNAVSSVFEWTMGRVKRNRTSSAVSLG